MEQGVPSQLSESWEQVDVSKPLSARDAALPTVDFNEREHLRCCGSPIETLASLRHP
jgi:hypothetical protein